MSVRRAGAIPILVVAAACREPQTTTALGEHDASAAPAPSALATASGSSVLVADAAPPIPDVVPASIACIVKYYGGAPRRDPTGWVWVASDGKTVPYHDGTTRIEDRWLTPTIEDLFEQRYHVGTITPAPEGYDPGRLRNDTIFFSTFGHDAAEVQKALVAVRIAGKLFMVHQKIKPQLERVAVRVAAELKKTPSLADYFDKPGGTFNWRLIAGTSQLSNHSWAVALDLDVPHSNYWRNEPGVASGAKPIVWKNRYPQAIVDAFEAEGFIWGGRWFHFDTMHFEYRPELIDPSCYP